MALLKKKKNSSVRPEFLDALYFYSENLASDTNENNEILH